MYKSTSVMIADDQTQQSNDPNASAEEKETENPEVSLAV